MPGGRAWPRLSIVTPSFNQGAFIEETLRSVLLQGYPNLEYFVIDGGSTDQTIEIIRAYSPWLTAWVSERDNGQAAAINKGFRLSSGDLMAWVNSDDSYAANTLGLIGRFFGDNPAARIVSGFRRNVSASNDGGVRVYPEPDAYSLSRCCYVAQEATFWTRTVWDTVGGLDESFRFALDYDFWQRILRAGFRFDLLPMYAGRFRLHPESKGSRWADVRAEELRRIYSTYLGTTKSELELWAEISARWWRRVRLLHRLAHRGILNHLGLAKVIVRLLSLSEARIPNFAGERVAFGFE